MKNTIFILTLFFVPVLFSCSNANGEKFIGKWATGHGMKIEITREGADFLVKIDNPAFSTKTYMCKLKDGALVNDGQLGTINYIESSGHLAGAGKELTKITDTTK